MIHLLANNLTPVPYLLVDTPVMAASDPEVQPWGFIVYRTVYTPESNAVWDSVTTELQDYANNSSPSGIAGGKWTAPRLWYMDDASLYDGLSLDQVRDIFADYSTAATDLFNEGAFEEFSRGARWDICLVIDEEAMYSIVNYASDDASESIRLFNRPRRKGPKPPIPYVKAVERCYEPPDPNPPGAARYSPPCHYPGWMKAGILWLGTLHACVEMEHECPHWYPNLGLGDDWFPVYEGEMNLSFLD
ncbi:uncharacterized protein GIQ15_01945 [Arthroderma uncinatum]|uniref:uncharacterized protein n=1 Tax=Arthroderma uncinatum TaxID=74035 RepID=UPI00144AA7A8|nr:uncharacterized protein GIQ15_01945 [Arthroderma uncinatum]KAF3492428.1 hypothetical protein GIQ15_01945 [Arthroderma uncinatum]